MDITFMILINDTISIPASHANLAHSWNQWFRWFSGTTMLIPNTTEIKIQLCSTRSYWHHNYIMILMITKVILLIYTVYHIWHQNGLLLRSRSPLRDDALWPPFSWWMGWLMIGFTWMKKKYNIGSKHLKCTSPPESQPKYVRSYLDRDSDSIYPDPLNMS